YMEHTLFTVTDSWPDVLFGYAVLFFLGALWAGIGGGALGLALTLPRSRLEPLARVFVSICVTFLAVYAYLLFNERVREAYEQFTLDQFHDGEWLAAVIVPTVAIFHYLARPGDRHAALVFLWCSLGWWLGYLVLTKFGGIVLAPPFRSESWGGVLGVLLALMLYLTASNNRAAMLLCRYGVFGGGLGFMFAVFLRHPVRVAWGPFAPIADQLPQWKIAEELFGLFMGIAMGLGVSRLEREGLTAAAEDRPRKPLDIFAVFVMLVALMWVNLRRAPMDWLNRYENIPNEPILGVMPWLWFFAGGITMTAVGLYALFLYSRDALVMTPSTAFGKGALILILLLWMTAVGGFVQHFPGNHGGSHMLVDASFVLLCAIATAMLLKKRVAAEPAYATAQASDTRWRAGSGTIIVVVCSIAAVFAVSGISKAMQDGPAKAARLRFGENAYWRQQAALIGVWSVVGYAPDDRGEPIDSEGISLRSVAFLPSRFVVLEMADGTRVEQLHRWHYMNSQTHLDWNDKSDDPKERVTVALTLRGSRVYIPWPPDAPTGKYLVLEKAASRE
ncbi:MAG: hypothetical protein SGI88_06605, partial [Candidatus Hydrogenedentes bacterium]|nr:hypothetical protein [Candidatus Hydrogenedentota bacterium]